MSEPSFPHSFVAVFPFFFICNAMNFFIHSLNKFILKKKLLTRCWFSSVGYPYLPCICKYTFKCL